ncbi:hypothetical protein ACFQ3S_10345 [Mucilaginibacter terrae]|uniref:hypothetical protein n=1 Tax=Mucilaginibacter terrae TaxID=1955052 RepID=UPI0036383311
MNNIYKQVIDTSYKYYYVLDEAKILKLDLDALDNFKRSIPNEFKNIPFNNFLTVINRDTLPFKWSSYPLPKARYVDRYHLPKNVSLTRVFKYVPASTDQYIIDSLEKRGIIPIRTQPNTRSKKAEKLIKKWIAAYNKRPKEEKNFYVISKPVFTSNKQYGLIKVDEAGQGCTYIFKNQNGQWIIIIALHWVA